MTFYSDKAKMVDRIVRKRGAACTLRQTGDGSYDPATGTASVATSDYAGAAFRWDYDARQIDGTMIQADDVRFIVSPLQDDGTELPQPRADDQVIFAGATYTVVRSKPWNFDGTTAVGFELQVRA